MTTIVEMVKAEKQKNVAAVIPKEQLEHLKSYSEALASGQVSLPTYRLAGIDIYYKTPEPMYNK